jgi:hypothetical protein
MAALAAGLVFTLLRAVVALLWALLRPLTTLGLLEIFP